MRCAFFFSLLIFLGCSPVQKADEKITLDAIQLTDLSGKAIDVSQFSGKAVLVNFWATWCKPCLQEMPSLAITKSQLKDEPIVFLFASNETLERIARFKDKQIFEFDYFHLGNMEALNIQALPTTFIFDRNGKLKFSETGFRDWTSPESIKVITNVIKG
ncbi:MAG: TlpA family protein disulfide reductase [Cyclobacteriaceae bacterium]|nr:TlpA family protein disulfide reductase [Cyclobacteriaceae bacterium]